LLVPEERGFTNPIERGAALFGLPLKLRDVLAGHKIWISRQFQRAGQAPSRGVPEMTNPFSSIFPDTYSEFVTMSVPFEDSRYFRRFFPPSPRAIFVGVPRSMLALRAHRGVLQAGDDRSRRVLCELVLFAFSIPQNSGGPIHGGDLHYDGRDREKGTCARGQSEPLSFFLRPRAPQIRRIRNAGRNFRVSPLDRSPGRHRPIFK